MKIKICSAFPSILPMYGQNRFLLAVFSLVIVAAIIIFTGYRFLDGITVLIIIAMANSSGGEDDEYSQKKRQQLEQYKEIVLRCLDNPQKTSNWKDFVNEFDGLIKKYLVRIADINNFDPAEIHDWAQEVYKKLVEDNCRALRSFSFEPGNSFRAFLFKIASSVAINHLKKSGRLKRNANIVYLFDKIRFFKKEEDIRLIEILPAEDCKEIKDTRLRECWEIFEEKLREIIPDSENKERNIFIYRLYELEKLQRKEIVLIPGLDDLESSTIGTIIDRIRKIIKQNFTPEELRGLFS